LRSRLDVARKMLVAGAEGVARVTTAIDATIPGY
jgi:hypothetical protein